MTEEERFYEVWKAERRVVFGQTAVVLLMTAVIWYFVWSWQMVDWMFLNFAMFLFLCFPVFSAGYLLQTLFLLIWYFTGKRKLEKGEKVRYSLRIGYRIENLAMFLSLFLVILWRFWKDIIMCACRAGGIFVFLCAESRGKFFPSFQGGKVPGRADRICRICPPWDNSRCVGSGGVDLSDAECEHTREFRKRRLAGTDITYELYRSDIPWVMDMVWDRQKGDQEPGWEIESPREVSYHYGKRSFQYEDAVLVLTYSEDEPNQEQIRSLQDRYNLREREVI